MKSFIVSLTIILIGTANLIYRDDLNRYQILQENFKHLTEECACYSAWALDDSEGEIRINQSLAKSYVRALISEAEQSYAFRGGHIEFSDSDLYVYGNGRAVSVELNYVQNKSFFRLSFSPKVNTIHWKSCYVWEN